MTALEHIMVSHPVRDVVAALQKAGQNEKVPFGTLIAGFGNAAFPPCLLVPALLVVSPLSGIPLFSSFCALVICLIAAQGALGRNRIWLPGVLTQRTLSGDRLQSAAHTLRHVVRISEYVTRPRLTALTSAPMQRVIYGFMIAIAACVPVLELVPFASSMIGAVIALLAIALLTRDGILLIVALLLAVGAALLVANLAQFVAEAVA